MMSLEIAEIDLILDIIVILVLFTNLLVLGKALSIIDCLHDHMHEVLDNIVPIEVKDDHDHFRENVVKLFEDLE
jgi:hypothetical protein